MIKYMESGCIIHCCLVGDCKVGKTTLARSFLKEELPVTYETTIFDHFAGGVTLYDDRYTISLFDNSGLRVYEALRAFSYNESKVVIMCFSMADRKSFNNIRDVWVPEINNIAHSKKSVLLVGIQNDSEIDGRSLDVVTTDEGHKLAKEIRAKEFLQCSIVDSDDVNNIFETVVRIAKRRQRSFRIIRKLLVK